MNEFDSFLATIKRDLQNKGAYIMFIEGDYGLMNPPFFCNSQESVNAFISPSLVGSIGFERIIIYKSAYSDTPIGAFLENISNRLLENLQYSNRFYGKNIKSIIEGTEKDSFYIKFLD